jgi:hypothetical protein
MRPSLKLTTKVTITGWLLSIAVSLFATFITWQWNMGFSPNAFFGAIYAALFRGLWALAMAWVVIACHYGKGGVVNCILSWSPFVSLSRVSYTAYIIHPGLMYVFVASTRSLFLFSHFMVLYLFLSHLVATFVASFLLSLVVEAPFVALEGALYQHLFLQHSEARRAKYYYSVNAISASDLGHSEKSASVLPGPELNGRRRPLYSSGNSEAKLNSSGSPSKREQLPLTERLSNSSTASDSPLVKDDSLFVLNCRL